MQRLASFLKERLSFQTLVSVICLSPAIAATTSLKNGVGLSIAYAIMTFPILFLFYFISKKIALQFRVPLLCFGALLMIYPTSLVLNHISTDLVSSMGVYLPLIAVSLPFTAYAYPMGAQPNTLGTQMTKAGLEWLFFSILMCVLSAVREILSVGMLYGKPFSLGFTLRSATMPFFALFLVAFLLAAFQLYSRRRGTHQPHIPDTTSGKGGDNDA